MKFDAVKKILIDPLTNKRIKVPSVKDIMALKQAGTYETFLELSETQKASLSKNLKKVAVSGVASAILFGISAVEYAKSRTTNAEYFDKAELTINESVASNEINK